MQIYIFFYYFLFAVLQRCLTKIMSSKVSNSCLTSDNLPIILQSTNICEPYFLFSVLLAEVGTRDFFWVCNRNFATWRKHFRHRNSATFLEMLLRKCNSAIPQSQFFLKSATLNPQLESFTSAIFGIFLARESSLFMNKLIGGKISRTTVPLRQVLFPEKQTILKIILVDFKAILSWGKGTRT